MAVQVRNYWHFTQQHTLATIFSAFTQEGETRWHQFPDRKNLPYQELKDEAELLAYINTARAALAAAEPGTRVIVVMAGELLKRIPQEMRIGVKSGSLRFQAGPTLFIGDARSSCIVTIAP